MPQVNAHLVTELQPSGATAHVVVGACAEGLSALFRTGSRALSGLRDPFERRLREGAVPGYGPGFAATLVAGTGKSQRSGGDTLPLALSYAWLAGLAHDGRGLVEVKWMPSSPAVLDLAAELLERELLRKAQAELEASWRDEHRRSRSPAVPGGDGDGSGAPSALADSAWSKRLLALGACHHATAQQVATAVTVGITHSPEADAVPAPHAVHVDSTLATLTSSLLPGWLLHCIDIAEDTSMHEPSEPAHVICVLHAARSYTRALAHDPGTTSAWAGAARTLHAMGDLRAALMATATGVQVVSRTVSMLHGHLLRGDSAASTATAAARGLAPRPKRRQSYSSQAAGTGALGAAHNRRAGLDAGSLCLRARDVLFRTPGTSQLDVDSITSALAASLCDALRERADPLCAETPGSPVAATGPPQPQPSLDSDAARAHSIPIAGAGAPASEAAVADPLRSALVLAHAALTQLHSPSTAEHDPPTPPPAPADGGGSSLLAAPLSAAVVDAALAVLGRRSRADAGRASILDVVAALCRPQHACVPAAASLPIDDRDPTLGPPGDYWSSTLSAAAAASHACLASRRLDALSNNAAETAADALEFLANTSEGLELQRDRLQLDWATYGEEVEATAALLIELRRSRSGGAGAPLAALPLVAQAAMLASRLPEEAVEEPASSAAMALQARARLKQLLGAIGCNVLVECMA